MGTVPVYSIDRYEGCLNLDDIAYLLKGTDYAFTYSIESTEGSETEKMILIQLDESYSGTGLSVQEDADEGDITADQLPGWFIQYGDQGNGSIPVFSKEESYFVSLDAVSQLMGFEIEFVGDQLNIVTIPDEVEVPEEIQVLQMKFPGSFANLGENAGNYALTDPSNYDVITMQTAELADIIDFEKLIRSGMQYVLWQYRWAPAHTASGMEKS